LTVGSDYGPYLREAMDLGIKKNVLFIGKKTPEETIDLMRLADICLTLIACGGNTPSKILNYFLAGRPILACDSPAHKEFLSDGNNAIFCNNDPIDFAKKLIYLLKNNDVRQRLAHASSEYARNFTIDAFRNKWKNILKNFEK
jgi:glycosyltransferase involved in cell wall biosynthesis